MRTRSLPSLQPFAILLFLHGMPATALAGNDILIVPQNGGGFQIATQDLLKNDPGASTLVAHTAASRGELIPSLTAAFVTYVPDPELFWEAGMDSFRYTWGGSSQGSATVFLVADPFGEPTVDLRISTVSSPGSVTLTDGTFATPAPPSPLTEVSLNTFAGPAIIVNADKNGSSESGGRAEICLDPDPFQSLGDEEILLISFSVAENDDEVELWGRQTGSKFEIRATSEMTDRLRVSTPWTAIASGMQTLAVSWWSEHLAGAGDGGLLLTADGKAIAFVTAGESAAAVIPGEVTLKFGPRDSQGNVPGGAIPLGNPRYWQGPARMELDPIFADGVESGDLVAWSGTLGSPSASPQAAVLGAWGVAVPAAAQTVLVDDSPNGETRYRARFHLDVATLDLSPGQELAVLGGFGAGRKRHFSVVLRGLANDALEICGRVPPPSGAALYTDCQTVAGGPHSVKAQWWAGKSSLPPDGGLRLWVDGELVGQILDVPSIGHRIEEVRFGALDPWLGTSGTLFFDDFESWR